MKGLDDGFGIGGVGVADGVGVDVSVSEWSLQADPARSRNASAMLLSSFFTIECYDSMRQRNQIYLERWTSGWTACKFQAGYAFNTPSNGWICLSEKERSWRQVMQFSADGCKRTTAKKFDPSAREAVLDSHRFVSTRGYKLTKRILLVPRLSSQHAHNM